jgi:Uma2 family endonuclease
MSADAVFEAVFAHAGPWTEDDWLAIPDTPARIELVSGVLVVNALPDARHQRLTKQLTNRFDATCPNGDWEAFPGLNVRLWADHARIPDVVVARTGVEGRIIDADAILVLVEITSPSNFRQDRVTKHGEYAEARVPFYLRVDLHLGPDDLTASAYELVNGAYHEYATAPDGVLRLTRPWPLEADLRAMARGR